MVAFGRRQVASSQRTVVQPRLIVGVALVLAAIVWGVIRGVHFYGVSPLHIGYDIDQPPVLVLLVGYWMLYRSVPR